MIEYTVYYKGRYYTINANSVDLLWQIARQRYSAEFAREAMLCSSKATVAASIAKVVA